MKKLVSIIIFLYSSFGYCQDKAGIFEYGNPTILIAPVGDTNNIEIINYLLNTSEIAFNEEEDHVYIRTDDDSYYFKNNPGKRIFAECDLLSQQVTMLKPDDLPMSKKGRGILALFTSKIALPAYRNEKKERNGWQSELWLSSDLKVKVGTNYNIGILDTSNHSVHEIILPNPVNDYKENRFAYSDEKPKDFDVDLRFCYYAKANLLYICANWGLRFPNEAERIWQYDMGKKTLIEIPLYSINAKDIDYDSQTTFCNDHMIRTIDNFGLKYIEIVSLQDGKLVTKSKESMDTRYPLPLTPIAYLPQSEQLLSFNMDKLNYYDKDIQYQRSFTLDMGKGVKFDEPALLSRTNKFIVFIKIFKHPEIGYYYSVNFSLFEDLKNSDITSLNNNNIHAPLITQNYATQDFERKKELIAEKQKQLDKAIANRELTDSLLKIRNDELLALYHDGNYAYLLEYGDIWRTENADYSWEIGKTDILNTATRYNFSVTYDIRFQTATVESGNYVNMTVNEHTEAHEGFKLIAQEDKLYGESYYKPTAGSKTLIRNPNYRFGNTYMNFDKPEAQQFLPYLEKYTDLFTGNSFEIIEQQQIGLPIVALKFPSKASGKFIYVYQQGIYGLLVNHINLTKEIEDIKREISKIQ